MLNHILEFTKPKSGEGNMFVMSHIRRSLLGVFSRASERAFSLLSSPGTDPPAATCWACRSRFPTTFWIRRLSPLLSLTHTHPIPVTVAQTLTFQNKRKGKVQRGLRNVKIFTRWLTSGTQGRTESNLNRARRESACRLWLCALGESDSKRSRKD